MEKKIKSNEVYTTKEVQDYLKISKSTLKRLLKGGIIKANKVGGQYRVLGREILSLISPEVEKRASDVYQQIKQKTKETIGKW
jgi:excisionase family DNA binding protein